MAARTENKAFGSFALTVGANGVNLETWRNRLLRNVGFAPMVKGDGSIRTSDALNGQEVTLTGQVMGTDTGDTDTKLAALLNALSSGEDDLSLFSDRELRCALAAPVNYNLKPGSGGLVYEWNAKFRSRFPTWRATSDSTSVATKTGVGPFTLTVGAGGGSAPSGPVIQIENLGVAFSDKFITFTHTGSLKQFQLIGLTLAANQSAYLNMEEGRLGDGVSQAIRPFALGGQFFDLRAAASNTIEVAHTIGAGANIKFTTTWRARHWSI